MENTASKENRYQLIIDCEQESGEIKRLYLDTCFDKTVTASAEIATQPLQSGLTMSDHMYSLPDTFAIRGTFSLYGNLHDDYDDFEGVEKSTDRLTNIENVFEYIKDNGLLCNLITLNEADDGTVRFKMRKSMALKDITWEEKLASINYSLTFKEVITVQMQDVPIASADYPITIMPSAKSLGQLLVDMNDGDIAKMVLLMLYKNGYVKSTDLEYFYWVSTQEAKDMIKIELQGVGVGVIAALSTLAAGLLVVGAIQATTATATAIATAIGITASTASIVPAGTIIAAAAAVVIGVVCCFIYSADKKKKQQKLNKAFNLVNNIKPHLSTNANGEQVLDVEGALKDPNCKINNTDLIRLMKLITDVKTAVIDYSSGVNVYQLSTGLDDNSQRTVVITIAGNSYYINIIEDESTGWKFSVTTLNSNGELVGLDGTNGIQFNNAAIVTDLNNCDVNENCFFCDKTFQYYVYIFNPSLSAEVNKSQDEQDNVKTKLYGYQIIVSDGDMSKKVDKLNKVIKDTIKSRGYL